MQKGELSTTLLLAVLVAVLAAICVGSVVRAM